MALNYYQDIYKRVANRSPESTVSIWGINNKSLRKYLINELSKTGSHEGLLADPVFESVYGWAPAGQSMETLSGDLLHPKLVDAMDFAKGHEFKREWSPFKHQLRSWQCLLNENKSVVVTSGTGSGKTECFMVPILNDLVKEAEAEGRLEGVRALFLYPLNALINSQRDRLRAWTSDFKGKVRFCLYNGNTPNNKASNPKEVKDNPNEVFTRKLLRESPSPVLVTNATMLEYMLVRNVDAPILQQSQGKLRWIVLDEAHTYVGSQAAELSLLLRRVMLSFGVKPKDVRFVATSATIGDDKEAEEKLQKFLASVAGISQDQVVVVGGKRQVPKLPSIEQNERTLDEILEIDSTSKVSDDRYKALVASSVAQKLRALLNPDLTPKSLLEISEKLFGTAEQKELVLKWIDLCSATQNSKGEAFLPLRGHFFHQVVNGLWACSNGCCEGKNGTELEEDWPFGKVFTQQKKHCTCGAPVFELVFCNECNTPYLRGVNSGGKLHQHGNETIDEFSLDIDEDDNLDEEISATDDDLLITPKALDDKTYAMSLSADSFLQPADQLDTDINILADLQEGCITCEHQASKRPFYRRALLGAPFYVNNIMPILLDACSESDKPAEVPYRGKKLITFSDSRQGTARISIKLQQASELDSVRSSIYSSSIENIIDMPSDKLLEMEQQLEECQAKFQQYKDIDEDVANLFSEKIQKLTTGLDSAGASVSLTWNQAVHKLQTTNDISKWIHDYYRKLNPSLFSGNEGLRTLTELLLLREFSRRPKRQNSLETLGLVSVQYPALESVKDVPNVWAELKLNLSDWKSFLKVVLDFYVRDRVAVDIPQNWVAWFGAKLYPTRIISPISEDKPSGSVIKWPQYKSKGQQHRLVRLLEVALELNINSDKDQDYINEILKQAWTALTKPYQVGEQGQYIKLLQPLADIQTEFQLNRSAMAFRTITEAWSCPVTNRFIDNVFKGITPYLPKGSIKPEVLCSKRPIPVRTISSSQVLSLDSYNKAVNQWLQTDQSVSSLREESLWSNVTDRVIENSGFYASAEHSAQQSAQKLQQYEARFKANKINVLNCSTTMEMGVDIGGISVVEMNNVPPHPANYLQRAGRAGRRGETQSLAFTICKNNTHEKNVFANPKWPFETNIKAPSIILDSDKIVKRHVNAYLLSTFFKNKIKLEDKEATSLTCDWFFNNESSGKEPFRRFILWLEGMQVESSSSYVSSQIEKITLHSGLSSTPVGKILIECVQHLEAIAKNWKVDYQKVEQELAQIHKSEHSEPYAKKLSFDLKNLESEYLLSMLAASTFLPGYGFPTGIVSFDNYTIKDFKRARETSSVREDNNSRLRGRPTRNFAVAIREYAPGAEVVLDGLVYKSSGVLLNKFVADSDFSEPQTLETAWRCHHCGAIGHSHGGGDQLECNQCGTEVKPANKKKYITPDAFTVDFYSEVKNDVSTQTYIPVEKEWVTANSDIQSLFKPEVGKYRVNTEGNIFYHSSGKHGKGYAVCLHCGRADSMEANGDLPLVFHKPHNKLQGKKGSGDFTCSGSHENYGIQPNLYLGGTEKTDVFELYLKQPLTGEYLTHKEGENHLPWTLAVAFREALTEIHGIDATEIGYDVKPIDLPDSDKPVAAIVLYDTNGGGSGFASSAHRHLEEVLLKSKRILDCRDNCSDACQSCLLSFETRFDEDNLNRHVALEYLDVLTPLLELPADHKTLGSSTSYCFDSIFEEILAHASSEEARLTIFTTGSYKEWAIDNSNLKQVMFNFRDYFKSVTLALPYCDFNELNEENSDDLLMLSRLGIDICKIDDTDNLYKNNIVAQILSEGSSCQTFASIDVDARKPGLNWWDFSQGILLRSSSYEEIKVTKIYNDVFKKKEGGFDVELDITDELNGALSSFGDNLWESLINASFILKKQVDSSISLQKITYSDCYINSPWVSMLLGEVVDSLRKKLDEDWQVNDMHIITGTIHSSSHYQHPGLYKDFPQSQDKELFLVNYFGEMGIKVNVSLNHCKDIHHSRFFILEWSDGQKIRIRLDQGVGCWSYNSSKYKPEAIRDFGVEMVSHLFNEIPKMEVFNSKKLPTQITVKKM